MLRRLGGVAGPLAALLILLLVPANQANAQDVLSFEGRVVLAMASWMAIWWIFEIVPIQVTALLPLVLLPIMGVQSFQDTAQPYGHSIIFLALGGFLLAAGLEKWNLHRRFAAFVLSFCGGGPKQLVAGFMAASAILSMWISNTAAAIIMLPIALSVIRVEQQNSGVNKNLAPCLFLAIAYACSMGGMTTLVGTTTNMFFAGYMETEIGRPVSFAEWTMFAGPVAAVMLVLIWFLLAFVLLPVKSRLASDLSKAQPQEATESWSRGGILMLGVFVGVALTWAFLPILNRLPGLENLTMYVVSVVAIFLLFLIPASKTEPGALMDWTTAREKVPWGILILIGGGLTLASAFSKFGVSAYLAYQISAVSALPLVVVMVVIVSLMIFLTEVTSNVASVTALTPVMAAMALGIGVEPAVLLVGVTMAASCAFMLPVATPPNAVVFGSNHVTIGQMVRAGFVLNIIAIGVVSLWTYFVGNLMFGGTGLTG